MATNIALAHIQGISTQGNQVTFDLKVTVFEHNLPRRPELNDVIEVMYDANSIKRITKTTKAESADCMKYIAQYITSQQQEKTR